MNIFRKPRAQNLSEWLEIATNHLAAGAKVRICTDITSHYEEALEGHLQNGLPRSAAQAAALAELGDASAAARRFRSEHLREFEFRKLVKLLKSGRLSLSVHCGGLLDCCWFGSVLSQHYGHAGSLFSVTLLVALFIIYEVVALILARRKNPRLLLLMESVSQLNLGIVMCYFLAAPPYDWGTIMLLLSFSLAAFSNALADYRLRNKLGKVAEDWLGEAGAGRKEIPPDNPIAS